MVNFPLIKLSAMFKHIKTIRDVAEFLEAILSPRELGQLQKRIELLERAAEGEDRRKIAKDLKISTSTVSRGVSVFRALEKENPKWWREFKVRRRIEPDHQ